MTGLIVFFSFLALLSVALLFAWIGSAMASRSGIEKSVGFGLGLVLGPLGLLVLARIAPSPDSSQSRAA